MRGIRAENRQLDKQERGGRMWKSGDREAEFRWLLDGGGKGQKAHRGSELRGKGERASEPAEGQLVWWEVAQRQEASFQQRGKTRPWFHYRRQFFLFLIPRFRE